MPELWIQYDGPILRIGAQFDLCAWVLVSLEAKNLDEHVVEIDDLVDLFLMLIFAGWVNRHQQDGPARSVISQGSLCGEKRTAILDE